ncbi:MAG: indolepyruvate oxidoreductase subunit beta family protein [Rhodobiaceae bacterium]|nr:indolepyruvate oxidoreductase subunit beta family protein [Rhodobiaceae bacterium]
MSAVTRLLIAALGGEGGGVLSGWVVAAAQAQGHAVQATSVPGVAQRTGATTYYVEIGKRDKKGAAPVFALMPVEGGVDVVVASELLEAARMVERGFVTPDRTFLLASTHRVLTVPEKSARGDGTANADTMMRSLEKCSKERFLFDMAETRQQVGTIVNSVMLGAMAGLELLPISKENYLEAMQGTAGSAANLRGFEAGFAIATGEREAPQAGDPKRAPRPMAADPLAARVAGMPEGARDVVRIGVGRLIDYQDVDYARLYLDRLQPFMESGPLLRELARHLAVRMSYEDIIRVAQLKVRPERFSRIRSEIGIDGTEPFEVVDFFKPGIPELADLLPPALGRRLLAWAARAPEKRGYNIGMKVKTTSISGFLRVWLLARMRFWRRRTLRFAEEQAQIEGWLKLVERAQARDPALAREVADLARIVKGYGDTHRRAVTTYRDLVERVVDPALSGDGTGKGVARRLKEEISQVLATH